MRPGIEPVLGDLRTAASLPRVQQIVRSAARNLTGADGATFVLRDGDRCFYADEDAISPLWKGQRFPITNCISGWAMLHAEPVVVADIFADERIPHEAYRPTFVKSLMMVPIGTSHPIGAIGTYWAHHHEATDEERQLIHSLAAGAADALARIGLESVPSPPALGSDDVARDHIYPTGIADDLASLVDHERIARDLHDTVIQDLFAAGLRIQALSSTPLQDEVRDELIEVVGMLKGAIQGLRGAILGLQYGHQRLGGIEGAILASVAKASRTLGFDPEVRLELGDKSIPLRLAHELTSALNEMLSNVARHSGATAATVTCKLVDGAVEISVADNGKGLSAQASQGSGLKNLASRAELQGGSFSLRSHHDGGTVASWRVPLNSA